MGGADSALSGLMAKLRARRQSLGLSLTEASERSGLTCEAIVRLEDRIDINPTIDTLYRYSMALDALIGLSIEEMEADWR